LSNLSFLHIFKKFDDAVPAATDMVLPSMSCPLYLLTIWSKVISRQKGADYFSFQPQFGYTALNGKKQDGCLTKNVYSWPVFPLQYLSLFRNYTFLGYTCTMLLLSTCILHTIWYHTGSHQHCCKVGDKCTRIMTQTQGLWLELVTQHWWLNMNTGPSRNAQEIVNRTRGFVTRDLDSTLVTQHKTLLQLGKHQSFP
jgi:hypothetical protein